MGYIGSPNTPLVRFVSAGEELNQDFNILGYGDGDRIHSVGTGTPQNGPSAQSAPFIFRFEMFEEGQPNSAGAVVTGFHIFENANGVWSRTVTRSGGAGGSLSYAAWIKCTSYTSPLVQSVNSATGVVTVTLNTTGT